MKCGERADEEADGGEGEREAEEAEGLGVEVEEVAEGEGVVAGVLREEGGEVGVRGRGVRCGGGSRRRRRRRGCRETEDAEALAGGRGWSRMLLVCGFVVFVASQPAMRRSEGGRAGRT